MTHLPPPLRGNELGTFTHHSVVVRLPEIGRRMVADNDLPLEQANAVTALIDSIGGGVIEPLDGAGPDQDVWDGYVAPHEGDTWLDAPWFFVEYYFYRRLLDAVGYWHTQLDPFRRQKDLGLEQALPAARDTITAIDSAYARGVSTDFLLVQLTDNAIWGNQVDLSLWPAEAGSGPAIDSNSTRLLVDERPLAIRSLRDRRPPPIDFVIDNAGSEVVADLLTADLLLRSDLTSRITIHAKQYPIFVSDVTPSDLETTVRTLAADSSPHLRSAGERLRAELDSDRLVVTADPFWVSPLEWRDRSNTINASLAEAGLIIVKGDANYRRLLGDRHWDYSTPFVDAIGATPAPLLALRTLKSEVAAGLAADAMAAAQKADREWMQNGRWAVAQYARQPKNPGEGGVDRYR